MNRIASVLCLFCLLHCFSSSTFAASDFCTEKTWFDRGVEVGSQGGSAKVLDKYMKKCKDAKTRENLRDYQRGFIVGMKQYCTFENGRKLGMLDKPINKLCPNEFSEEFVAGYKAGKSEKREIRKFMDDVSDDKSMLPGEGVPESYNSSPSSPGSR